MAIRLHREDPSTDHVLELTPRKTKKWLKSLPLANMGETTRRFYQALLDTRTQEVKPKQRLECMELLLPTAHMILSNVRKHLVSRTFPLSNKSHKILELQQAIVAELCAVYKGIANELPSAANRSDFTLLALSVYRSMDFAVQGIVASASLYSPHPKDGWKVVYTLYRFAENNGLLKRPIVGFDKTSPQPPTIEQLFLRVSILALCQTHAMGPGEIDRMAKIITELSDDCTVDPHRPSGSSYPLCCADLDSADPPNCRSSANPLETESIRYLHIDPLIQRLYSLKDQQSAVESNQPWQSSASLADRMVQQLTATGERRFDRTARETQMLVTFGFANTCRTLRDLQPHVHIKGDNGDGESAVPELTIVPKREPIEKNRDHCITRVETPLTANSALWDQVARGNCVSNAGDTAPSTLPTAEDTAQASPHCHVWNTIDSSKAGIRLECRGDQPSLAQVGELIAFREKNQLNGCWSLGVIRWMNNPGAAHTELGVQLLSTNIAVVGVEPLDSQNRNSLSALDGLLLSRPINEGSQPMLLVQTGQLSAHTKVLVNLGNREIGLTLTERIGQSALFEQYGYIITQQVNAQMDKEAQEDQSEQNNDDFNTIWSSL